MRILIFNWRDIKNPRAGGAEVFTHEIARRLVERGHAVTLFTSAFPGCSSHESIDGVDIIRSGGRIGVYLQAREQYRRALVGRYDVVIDEINTRPFMTPSFVQEPVVGLIHQLAREFWFYETPFPLSLVGRYWLEDRWLRMYRDIPVVTISESTQRDLIELGFRNVAIVPIGGTEKPLDAVPEKEERPTLLFAGRMGRAKLPGHAIEAFRQIRAQIPDAQLWMVGEGSLKDHLARSHRNPHITFFGRVPLEEKRRLMQRAHVLLVPAVREGWGLVVTEANAAGTPAVGYDVPGLRDSIRHRVTGLLTAANPAALAGAAIHLLRENEVRSAYARHALEMAGEFSWERSTSELEAVLMARVQ